MEQNNKTWFDALLKREDRNEILSSYIINHLQRFTVFGGIVGIEQFTDKEAGNMLKIDYISHKRLDKSSEKMTTMYWGEHSLFKRDENGKFVNELTLHTVDNSINTDIYNILSVANIGTIIDGTTYDTAHKTYCKKELARQYMEDIKRIREEERLLAEKYNSTIENVSHTLKDAKTEFRHKKSKKYPTM